MTHERLDYCNAYITNDGEKEVLISYATPVIKYYLYQEQLYCTGLYSRTTIKHIGRYLKRRFKYLNYYGVKKLVMLNNLTAVEWCIMYPNDIDWYFYNTETGEIYRNDEIKVTPKKVIFCPHD